ncbi:hypothetical protein [Streptacidiphilus fuscans]|uniref:Uncharacterized protein n=1 Tax=Streptacidiphilus fuscans TaxID=2789292 RepID=A0A931B781_9ACTN|nr:hypothetical protein [Streptacidiphilus fuscans]MBF9070747.1 hypothetical protein [Streptacidiphilus fuscans]
MNESRTKAGTDTDAPDTDTARTDTTHTGHHALDPRTRRRAGVVAAVLVTAGLAAATALLPNPAQAQERPTPTPIGSAHATAQV